MRWSKGVWVLTIFTFILFIAMAGVALLYYYSFDDKGGMTYLYLVLAVFFIAMLIYITLLIPQKVVVTDEFVKVKRALIPVTIDLKKVTYCRRIDKEEMGQATRIWGSGGFGGYWGWFFHRSTGRFRLFTGDMKNMYSFVLRNGKRFVVSLDPSDEQAMKIINRLIESQKK